MRADRDRWFEEVLILEEEIRRTIRSFDHYEMVWLRVAQEQGGGKAAYAAKRAAMFARMAANTRKVRVQCSCTEKFEMQLVGRLVVF